MTKFKSTPTINIARDSYFSYLSSNKNVPEEIHEKLKQAIEDKQIELDMFDEASKHVRVALSKETYFKFLASEFYRNLLKKLA